MPADSTSSPIIQNLILKGFFDRFPVTFSTFFFDQFQQWKTLFPAEQDYQERLFVLLDRSPADAVESLFAPLREVEQRMGVSEKTWPRNTFTSAQVDFLNRNPHSAEWRQAISYVFGRLDPLLDAQKARKGKPALVIVTAPAELPATPDRMWLRVSQRGKRIPIDAGTDPDYLTAMLTGGSEKSILETYPQGSYDSWSISAGRTVAGGHAVTLSYEALAGYRARLMSEVQRMVESGEVRTPHELNDRLKLLNIRASEGEFSKNEVLSEFVRAVLLNGNGTLLINNTFVEWATIQAIRRARPSVLVISFGIRNKLKPFSSLLMYTDQDAANPIPSQMDALGTYVDLEIFHQYIWQEFEKYVEYRNNTAYLFVADGAEELLCIAPPDFPLFSEHGPVKLSRVYSCAKDWLNL